VKHKVADSIKLPDLSRVEGVEPLSEFTFADEDEYSNTIIADADLSNQSATFVHVSSARINRTRFVGACLPKSRFTDVRFDSCDLSNAELKLNKLNRVFFANCKLTGLKLIDGKLSDVIFEDCVGELLQLFGSEIKSTMFKNCRFSNSDFRSCKFEDVIFKNCELSAFEIYDAKLKNVDFRGSHFEGLKAHAVDLKGAVIDYQQALDLASCFASMLGIRVIKD
jgi:uncharacterized protein YjbI with pentapeptide repeats